MFIVSEHVKDITVLSATGYLDDLTSNVFLGHIEKLLKGDQVTIVANLAEVKFVSGAGLRALLMALVEARHRGGDLRLAQVPQQANKILKITGADNVMQVYPDVETALDSF